MEFVKQSAKAFVAALIAFLSALGVVLVGDVGFSDITDGQWIASVLAGLVAFAGVWGVPNKPS